MPSKQFINSIFPKLFLFLVIVTILAITYQTVNISDSINVMGQTKPKPTILPSACEVVGPVAPYSTQYKNWNFDPRNTLANPLVNPELRSHLLDAIKEAMNNEIHVKIAWAYRSPSESAALHAAGEHAAANAWKSSHNYGMGIDIYVYDNNGKRIDSDTGHENWYTYYKNLAKIMKKHGFVWFDDYCKKCTNKGDAGHFNYQPSWVPGKVNWKGERDKAIKESKENGKSGKLKPADWLPYMWNNAGACYDKESIKNIIEPKLIEPKLRDCSGLDPVSMISCGVQNAKESMKAGVQNAKESMKAGVHNSGESIKR